MAPKKQATERFKFRAWIKPDNPLQSYSGMYDVIALEQKTCVVKRASLFAQHIFPLDCVEIMQWTGLTDRHGKEIYEGDIVKRSEGYNGDCFEPEWKCIVEWDDGGFALMRPRGAFIATLDSCEVFNMDIEVIGNVYENSNLLKEPTNEEKTG